MWGDKRWFQSPSPLSRSEAIPEQGSYHTPCPAGFCSSTQWHLPLPLPTGASKVDKDPDNSQEAPNLPDIEKRLRTFSLRPPEAQQPETSAVWDRSVVSAI